MPVPGVLPVLLGGDANVYGMARSFWEAFGVRSVAVCRRALPALAATRLLQTVVCRQDLGRDAVFVRTLAAVARAFPARARLLVPCADDYALQLARCQSALAAHYRFACPPPALVQRLGQKPGFAAACAAQGLRTPQTVLLGPGAPLPTALPFGWPAVVKPADQAAYAPCRFAGKRKVYLARDRAQLGAIAAAAAQGGYRGGWLVQEYIPGPDTALGVVNIYCAQDGTAAWAVQAQVLLQERTPEGTGNYAALLVEPARQDAALLAALRALLRQSGWRGFANFDLKYAPGGEPILFEMNPRPGRSSYACTAAGANLALPLAADLLDGRPPAAPALRPAVWYTAPWGVVRRFCPGGAALQRAAVLRRRGRGRRHLLANGEGPARRVWFLLRQAGYWRKVGAQWRTGAL